MNTNNGGEDFSDFAETCIRSAESIHWRIRSWEIPHAGRAPITVALGLVAVLHAKASVRVIASMGQEAVCTAAAMQRVMIEALLRAAFFSRAASDDELRDFLDLGRMPKRPGVTTRPAPISLRQLAQESAAAWGHDVFSRVLGGQGALDALNGLTHTGREILVSTARDGEFGPAASQEQLAGLLVHALSIAACAATLIANSASILALAELQDFLTQDRAAMLRRFPVLASA